MYVLVTGGAGFIGSHTVEALLAEGATVRILDNFSTGKRANLPHHPKLDIQAGDIRDAAVVGQAMQGVTHVLHLAAQVSVHASVESPPTSCSHNVLGFVTVLHAARSHGVQRLVYASSAAVYGVPDEVPVAERAPVRPISPYGLEKSIDEHYAALFQRLFGFPSLGLRYFNVYGPRQDPCSPYAGVISKFVHCAEQHRPLTVYGDGLQTRDFVFVRDVAAINVRALHSTMTGVCNVGTGTRWCLLDLIETLSHCLGNPLRLTYAPAQAGDIPHSGARIDVMRDAFGIRHLTPLSDGLNALLEERVNV
ncbi:MAG: NAD-dependent epimerase/dehydratase family protein [Nitrospirae bacterium]|nr:MAG: NAD-dependent epimerase/dehydratase family protein [Nitrospirota bacterium]